MNDLKTYDLIAIGTGSAMIILESMLRRDPDLKAAVIDKDDPGGICLTRGCIPTKMLIYPADMVRHVQEAGNLGVDAKIRRIDFHWIMERMRSAVKAEVAGIRESLTHSENVDYYHGQAEFVGPYELKVLDRKVSAKLIFLCLGSRPLVPKMEGLDDVQILHERRHSRDPDPSHDARHCRGRIYRGGVRPFFLLHGLQGDDHRSKPPIPAK